MLAVSPGRLSPRERLVVALDVDRLDEAERFVKLLANRVGVFKVGPRLFTNAGSLVFDLIHGFGSGVFLDLKFHDIPASVAAAAREVARQRVKMFTMHALGGGRMIRAVSEQLMEATLVPGAPPPLALAVTILTSHSELDVRELGFEIPIVEQVERLARIAVDHGAGGIVASGHELKRLKAALPEGTIFVTPGIRDHDEPVEDQTRVMTAEEAISAGATYVVVGRPIRDSRDPVGSSERIVEQIARACDDAAAV
ncbi:MAG: orotidine-5'-phosphate decarboxylase [Myxococcales bacterium]|nr:orotidine-5'-phosphate decarboxylase [Myxococcales bacterium]